MQDARSGGGIGSPPQVEHAAEELLTSRVVHVDQLPARKASNGTESLNVMRGQLATGEWVGVHESAQPAGAAPVALHRIGHNEFVCIRRGSVEFQHDGITERATAGDILFVASGTEHRVINVGDGPADYVVVAIGGDVHR